MIPTPPAQREDGTRSEAGTPRRTFTSPRPTTASTRRPYSARRPESVTRRPESATSTPRGKWPPIWAFPELVTDREGKENDLAAQQTQSVGGLDPRYGDTLALSADVPIEETKSWRRRYFTESGDPQGPVSFEIQLRGPNNGLEGQKDYLTWYYCDFLEQQPAHNPVDRDEVELGALLKWLTDFRPRSRIDAYPMLMVALEALHRFASGFVKVELAEKVGLAARIEGLEVLLASSESEREKERFEHEEAERHREEVKMSNPSVEIQVDMDAEDKNWAAGQQKKWDAEREGMMKALEETEKALKTRNKDLIQASLQIRSYEKDLKAKEEEKARIARLIEEMDEKNKRQQEAGTKSHEWILKSIMSSGLGANFRAWAAIARRNKRLRSSYKKTMHLWLGVEIRNQFNKWYGIVDSKITTRFKGKLLEARLRVKKKERAFRRWEMWWGHGLWEKTLRRADAHCRKVVLRDVGRWCFEEWRYTGWKIASLRESFVTVWGRTKESLLSTALLALRRNVFTSLKDRALAGEKAHATRRPSRASQDLLPPSGAGRRPSTLTQRRRDSTTPAPAFGEEGWEWHATTLRSSIPTPLTPAGDPALLPYEMPERPEDAELFLKSVSAASRGSSAVSRLSSGASRAPSSVQSPASVRGRMSGSIDL